VRLLVFRHGIAEDVSADGTDASRVLTPHGVDRTRKAAQGLTAFCDPPDVILTSPKARARQTADAAAEAFGSPIELLDELADGPPGPALSALAERPEETVMIFPGRPPFVMLRAAAWHVRNVPRRLVSITRSHSSTSMSSTARVG